MAGITHLKEFSKPALQGLVVEMAESRTPTFADTFLPDGQTFSSTFAYDVVKKSQHIAAYIGYGAEAPVVDRDAVASKMGEVAKMGLKYIATEEELLALNQARSDAEKSAIVEQLTIKAADLVTAIEKQVQVAKLEALLKGKFTYNKNGVKIDVDYGVPADHKVALTGTNAWTDAANAKPLSDLIAWNDKYIADNGVAADRIIVSREVLGLLQTNAEIISEARPGTSATRVSLAEVQAVLNQFGLPTIEVQNNRSIVVKDIYSGQDETIEFLPKYRVAFLGNGVGKYLFGPTVENDFAPGIALSAKDRDEPIQSIIKAVAAGVPVVENPNLLFFADVATA